MKRTVRVKLQPSKDQEKVLIELADTGAKVWNRVNYLRRQLFFQKQPVDFNTTEKAIYETYKREIGSATGLFRCPATGLTFNADPVGTLAIQGREEVSALRSIGGRRLEYDNGSSCQMPEIVGVKP
ncbi:hypothetical protein [Thermococcus sp. JdF3]|uniref:hypothetical protein n=1 Tax=Thermococcus sp. JdF3 TaxID=1638258 RepID=UPI001F0F1A5D|nr:hypothetical protein [Thermococcus sp. JdF3]